MPSNRHYPVFLTSTRQTRFYHFLPVLKLNFFVRGRGCTGIPEQATLACITTISSEGLRVPSNRAFVGAHNNTWAKGVSHFSVHLPFSNLNLRHCIDLMTQISDDLPPGHANCYRHGRLGDCSTFIPFRLRALNLILYLVDRRHL